MLVLNRWHKKDTKLNTPRTIMDGFLEFKYSGPLSIRELATSETHFAVI